MAAPPSGVVHLGPVPRDDADSYDDTRSRRSDYPPDSNRSDRGDRKHRRRRRKENDDDRDRDIDYERGDLGDRRDPDKDRDRDSRRPRGGAADEYYSGADLDKDKASTYAPTERSHRSHRSRRDRDSGYGDDRIDDRDTRDRRDRDRSPDGPLQSPRDQPRENHHRHRGDRNPSTSALGNTSQLVRAPPRDLQYPQESTRGKPGNEVGMPLPPTYYDDNPPQTALRRRDHRSATPPRRQQTANRKGDILSGIAGAAIATAADKYVIEPRMRGKSRNRGRAKSQHEYVRRAADIGVGGVAGTAIYRAVSRSRARKKDKRRGGSPDSYDSRGRSSSRGKDDSRDRSKSKSGLPWKSLLTTAAGGLAGLAAEQVSKSRSKGKDDRRRRNDDYSSDDDDADRRSRNGRDDRDNRRRHASADQYSRRGGGDRRDDRSDGGYDDRDRRDIRRGDRDRDRRRSDAGQNPNHSRDLVQEAIGLLGVAQGLRGKNKGQAAVQTAIGAYGIAQDYYTRHKAQQARVGPGAGGGVGGRGDRY